MKQRTIILICLALLQLSAISQVRGYDTSNYPQIELRDISESQTVCYNTALNQLTGVAVTSSEQNSTHIPSTDTMQVRGYDTSNYPQIELRDISESQTVCYNTAPNQLTGTEASGGSGSYSYQWQQSTEYDVTLNDIVGATDLNYPQIATHIPSTDTIKLVIMFIVAATVFLIKKYLNTKS